jgi:hypothetical protein
MRTLSPAVTLSPVNSSTRRGRSARSRRDSIRVNVNRVLGRGAARQLADERDAAILRAAHALVVHAALEAVGGFGLKAEPFRRAPHGLRVEVGALDEHVRRSSGNLRLLAAHHARDGDGARGVGDDEHLLVQLALDAVERLQLLARARAPDDDALLVQLREVEGVERLAHLVHHEVGDVGDVVDGALADGLKPLHEPLGRRRDLHAAHDARGVARAEVFVLDTTDVNSSARPPTLFAVRLGQRDARARERGGLARDAEVREAVGAVRR